MGPIRHKKLNLLNKVWNENQRNLPSLKFYCMDPTLYCPSNPSKGKKSSANVENQMQLIQEIWNNQHSIKYLCVNVRIFIPNIWFGGRKRVDDAKKKGPWVIIWRAFRRPVNHLYKLIQNAKSPCYFLNTINSY